MTFTEHDIEQALKHLQKLTPAETSFWRVKNVVMTHVRADANYGLSTNLRKVRMFGISSLVRRIKFAPAMAVVLIVLLGGGGTVAAAQNNIPGDALYRVKLASETLIAAVLPTQKAKVNFEAKRAQRRAQELVALTKKAEAAPPEKRPQVEAHIEETTVRLEVHLERVREVVEELKVTATPEALQTTTQVTEKIEVLEKQLEAVQKREETHERVRREEKPLTTEQQELTEPVMLPVLEEPVQKELRRELDHTWETVQDVFDLADTFEDAQHLPRTAMDPQLDEIMGLLTEAEDMFTAHNAGETRRLTHAAQEKLDKVKAMLTTKQDYSQEKPQDKKEEPPRDSRVLAPPR